MKNYEKNTMESVLQFLFTGDFGVLLFNHSFPQIVHLMDLLRLLLLEDALLKVVEMFSKMWKLTMESRMEPDDIFDDLGRLFHDSMGIGNDSFGIWGKTLYDDRGKKLQVIHTLMMLPKPA